MAFASDTFTGTPVTELSAYSAAWSKQSGFTTDAFIGPDGPYCIVAGNLTYGVYQNSGSPASADYSVFADVKRIGGTATPQMGVCGRMQSGAGTFYCTLHFHSLNQTRLYKCVSGAFTQLSSSYSNSLTTGVAQRHELRMSGSTISVHIDGGAAVISVTDTSITTAGKAGLIGFTMRDSGVADTGSIDNWEAVDAAPAATYAFPFRRAMAAGLLTHF